MSSTFFSRCVFLIFCRSWSSAVAAGALKSLLEFFQLRPALMRNSLTQRPPRGRAGGGGAIVRVPFLKSH